MLGAIVNLDFNSIPPNALEVRMVELTKKLIIHKTAITKAFMITKALPIIGYVIEAERRVNMLKQLSSHLKLSVCLLM